MNETQEECLARLIRDAYCEAYATLRPDFTAEEWAKLAMNERGVYKAMAAYLLRRGVRPPTPTMDPVRQPRKKASLKTGEGFELFQR